MRIIVRYFAIYREAAGESQVEMDVSEGATLGDVLGTVFKKHPKLEKWADSIVCSVNKKYADNDKVLAEGDEVALLPPVSGGSRMTEEDLQVEETLSSLKTEMTGAVVFFIGVVRKDPGTESVLVESYPEMAEEKMEEIAQQAKERFHIERMDIVHRTGELNVGENIVLIGASAPHRKEAFEACQWAIDEIKKIVPIWKKDQGGWIGQND